MRVNFIGLGRMGGFMARNLLRAKVDVRVHDVHAPTLSAFLKNNTGAKAVERGDADVTITALPGPKEVTSVYQQLSTSGLFIDCSTVDPDTSLAVREGRQFIDAPMSGGVVGAEAGTLTFMAGGDETTVREVAEPILKHMGKRVYYCGPAGSGCVAKLANNYLLGVSNIATAEAMAYGLRHGLDPKTLAFVINNSTGRCWPSEINNPVAGVCEGAPANRDFEGGFVSELMMKDLGLVDDGPWLLNGVQDIYKRAAAEHPKRDFGVVYKLLKTKA